MFLHCWVNRVKLISVSEMLLWHDLDSAAGGEISWTQRPAKSPWHAFCYFQHSPFSSLWFSSCAIIQLLLPPDDSNFWWPPLKRSFGSFVPGMWVIWRWSFKTLLQFFPTNPKFWQSPWEWNRTVNDYFKLLLDKLSHSAKELLLNLQKYKIINGSNGKREQRVGVERQKKWESRIERDILLQSLLTLSIYGLRKALEVSEGDLNQDVTDRRFKQIRWGELSHTHLLVWPSSDSGSCLNIHLMSFRVTSCWNLKPKECDRSSALGVILVLIPQGFDFLSHSLN